MPYSGDDINIEDQDTGQRYSGKRRRGIAFLKNGKRSNDYIQSSIRVFSLVKAAALMLSAVGVLMLGILRWVALPQFKAAVAAEIAPLADRLTVDEDKFDQHILDVATRSALYPTRDDLRRDLDEIKASLEAIRSRQK